MPHGAGFVLELCFLKENILNKFLTSLILVATSLFALNSQAAWDAKFLPQSDGLSYFSDYYVAEGDIRTVSQLTSFDKPTISGFLYVEMVTEYNCTQKTFQIVQSKGYRTWDDQGQPVQNMLGVWQKVKTNSNEQVVLNRLCNTNTLADAKKYVD